MCLSDTIQNCVLLYAVVHLVCVCVCLCVSARMRNRLGMWRTCSKTVVSNSNNERHLLPSLRLESVRIKERWGILYMYTRAREREIVVFSLGNCLLDAFVSSLSAWDRFNVEQQESLSIFIFVDCHTTSNKCAHRF